MTSQITKYTDKNQNIQKYFIMDTNYKNITMNNFKNLNTELLFHSLCHSIENSNDVILDYRYFKILAMPDNYDILIQYIMSIVNNVLNKYDDFVFHVCMKSLKITDVDKYYVFICKISEAFKTTFQDKLDKCYIYNAPFIFSQLITVISTFVDKKTQNKIEVVEKL